MADIKTKDKYTEGIGRRKNAIARVRIYASPKNSFTVNDKTTDEYFKTDSLKKIAEEALTRPDSNLTYKVTAKVSGGGINSQAESLRLGLARAMVKEHQELRKELKKAGYLKRDPRKVERKKFGLKKARKSAQWSKR